MLVQNEILCCIQRSCILKMKANHNKDDPRIPEYAVVFKDRVF